MIIINYQIIMTQALPSKMIKTIETLHFSSGRLIIAILQEVWHRQMVGIRGSPKASFEVQTKTNKHAWIRRNCAWTNAQCESLWIHCESRASSFQCIVSNSFQTNGLLDKGQYTVFIINSTQAHHCSFHRDRWRFEQAQHLPCHYVLMLTS